MKFALLLFGIVLPALAQTSPLSTNPGTYALGSQETVVSSPAHGNLSSDQLAEKMRNICIQSRRSICGRILDVLPGGLVVESGYTNLLREPLTSSWLIPGTVAASRPASLIESAESGAVCVGVVYLTNLPKSKKLKPKKYDYVIIEGYPAGQFTYPSIGTIHKTTRRFSAELSEAVALNLQNGQKQPAEGNR